MFEIDPERFPASYEAFLNAIHPEDRGRVDKAYTDSLKNRQPYEIEHRLLFPDGRIKWVREKCKTAFDSQGKALRSTGIVQDITSQKLGELQLRKMETFLEGFQNLINTRSSSVSGGCSYGSGTCAIAQNKYAENCVANLEHVETNRELGKLVSA